jgi:hypothetical protein
LQFIFSIAALFACTFGFGQILSNLLIDDSIISCVGTGGCARPDAGACDGGCDVICVFIYIYKNLYKEFIGAQVYLK